MKDLLREKFASLIEEVEELEEQIEACKDADKLLELQNALAEKRNELKRISDGCGKN
jgi:hypothetical protein